LPATLASHRSFLGSEHIRSFLVHLVEQEHAKDTTIANVVSGLKFLYRVTLDRESEVTKIPRPRRARRLPVILSREEVARLLATPRNPNHRALLIMGYGAGLRVSEVSTLRVDDIDSSRLVIFVRQGKGGKDRYVPLSARVLEALREYWRAFRPNYWLFPGRPPRERPMVPRCITRVATETAKHAGLKKRVGFHTLRHCFATHLLEAGVNIRIIQSLLGHNSISSTAHYSRITAEALSVAIKSPLDIPSDDG
jgi:integrase/recombinase XerD